MMRRLPVFIAVLAVGMGATWWGGLPFQILVVIAWLVMVFETSLAATCALGLSGRRFLWIDLIYSAYYPLMFLVDRVLGTGSYVVAVGMPASWFLLMFLLYPATRAGLSRWMFSGVVLPYLMFGVISFLFLRQMGLVWPLCVIATVAVADTVAYLVGTHFGRRKLAPTISPGKTVEGAVAGTLAAAAVAAVMLKPHMASLPLAALAGVGLAVLAVLGDLFESFLKRGLDIKDFGNTLPGHGGCFDRLDSLLAVSMGLFLLIHFVPPTWTP